MNLLIVVVCYVSQNCRIGDEFNYFSQSMDYLKYREARETIEALAKEYRKEWKEEFWESDNIEEFGLNEFLGGKAEGFEEALEILNKSF